MRVQRSPSIDGAIGRLTMFIRTRRLFLRPAWAQDARAIVDAIACWDIVRNLARVPWPYAMADAEGFLARCPSMPAAPSFLIFARTDADPVLVGGIGLARDDSDEVELGYWIARAHWGCGYATEAGRAVVELAFDGLRLPELTAGHFIDNPASGGVLRKLGFAATGEVRPTPCRSRGGEVPAARYALTRAAWAGRAPMRLAA